MIYTPDPNTTFLQSASSLKNADYILDEILANGSVNGRIKLHDIWNNHKQNDERRLKNELKKYTKHELKLLKRILNK